MKNLIFFIFLIFIGCDFSKNPEELPKTVEYAKIIGEWKLIESNVLPFDHGYDCKNLELNSIFTFDKYGIIKVYENDSKNKNCNNLQAFRIEENILSVFDGHVIPSYEILKLKSDTLVLKLENFIPTRLEDEQSKIPLNNGKLIPEIDFILNNGIILKLIKIKTLANTV